MSIAEAQLSSDLSPDRTARLLLHQRIIGTRASDHLNLVRGLAAVTVVCFHLRGSFFVDRTPGSGAALWLFYFLTALGPQAVMVFFVLSGFLIGANVMRSMSDQGWNWKRYLVNRLTRLYIVLIPALVLGALWDHFGLTLTGGGGIYAGVVPNASIKTSVLTSFSWPVFFGNILFLQRILVPAFGSNGPLWSLTNEFWYYLAFPFVALIFFRTATIGQKVVSVLPTLLIAIFVGYSIAVLFAVWLLGVGLNLLPKTRLLEGPLSLSIALALFFFSLALSYLTPGILQRALPSQLCVGFGSAVLIYVLLQSTGASSDGLYRKVATGLAGFSYTLYLVHLPLLVFIKAMVLPHDRWPVNYGALSAGCLILLVILGYAWVVSQLTEARTESVRDYAMSML
jgi:peptidoglycan/LPS O-acetylase OafA/YrhL